MRGNYPNRIMKKRKNCDFRYQANNIDTETVNEINPTISPTVFKTLSSVICSPIKF